MSASYGSMLKKGHVKGTHCVLSPVKVVGCPTRRDSKQDRRQEHEGQLKGDERPIRQCWVPAQRTCDSTP